MVFSFILCYPKKAPKIKIPEVVSDIIFFKRNLDFRRDKFLFLFPQK